MREQGSWTRNLLDDAFGDAGLKPERIMEVNDWEAVHELVVAGLGVSVLPQTYSGSNSRVVHIPLSKPTLNVTEYIVFLSARRRLKTIAAFLALAEGHVSG